VEGTAGACLHATRATGTTLQKLSNHFFKKNTTLKIGGNTDVAALPIEHSLLGWAIEA